MSGSIAEERIRSAVEATFRRRFPEARIIHELVLDQGGVRIDLAAVEPDRLVVAEIKSERDVLKRLATQTSTATPVAGEVWVFVAEKHRVALKELASVYVERPRDPPVTRRDGSVVTTQLVRNADYLPSLARCYLRFETAEGGFEPVDGDLYPRHVTRPDPGAMLQMLWAGELQWVAAGLGASSRATRDQMIGLAVEHLSGRQIRRCLCALLRSRKFPRADAPLPLVRPS